ncbi:MAG: 2-oxoglutarate dehydrogenase, E2 component, dihydrolipoamide succinyltransferase [Bacteroidota bacterium]
MKVDVVMPKMGESLQEGTIIRWFKKVGDAIERDEMILEISTDKVDTEVPAPVGGVLAEVVVPEGTTVEVGTVIARIETEGSAIPEQVSEAKPVAEEPAPASPAPAPASGQTASGNLVDVVMPKMGESLQEGTIIRWFKKVGDAIERDEMILEISTDKVDTEVPAPVGGVLAEVVVPEGTTVEVGTVIARIATSGTVVPSATVAKATEPKPEQTPVVQQAVSQPTTSVPAVEAKTFEIPARYGEKFFSPLVREIAKQNKVSLEELLTIKGSGSEGRITKDDLLKYIENRGKAPAAPQAAPSVAVQPKAPATPAVRETVTITESKQPAKPIVYNDADVEIIPMDRVRQLIAEHMVHSKHTSAHVTSVGEADVTGIVRFREKFKQEFEKREGIKLTYTPFFALAAIEATKKFPMVNVSVDGKNIIRHKRINLSFATALDDGNLIVPVIKNAEGLNLTGLQKAITDLSTRARTKKLLPNEIEGGTITITNVGTFGTLFGTPVINQPQVAIMGIGAIKKRPVVKEFDGEHLVVVRDMAYVSITYDHRVIDGMLAGMWLAEAIRILENMNEDTILL